MRGPARAHILAMPAIPAPTSDIAVVGAGLSGLAAALACARTHTVLVLDAGGIGATPDTRASFLSASSLRMMDRLGVEVSRQPVSRIVVGEGDPGRPLRGAPTEFGGEGTPMGAMVENAALHAALLGAARAAGVEMRGGVSVHGVEAGPARAEIETSEGDVAARLVVAADGPRSRLRTGAGIGVETHDYRREALSFTVAHSRPHDGRAYQIFFPAGPLALLPLPDGGAGHRCSVVWTDRPAAARAAQAMGADALAAELRRRIGDVLGEVEVMGEVARFPLRQVLAESLVTDRLALVGDAGHVIHPLAGQGLNLALRDAAALADVVADARRTGRDIGGPALADYDRWRRGDVRGMALATDALHHAYGLRGPLGALRRVGTSLVRGGVAARIAREAAGERPNLPALMA